MYLKSVITDFSINSNPVFRMKSLSFCPGFAVGQVHAEMAMKVLHSVLAFAFGFVLLCSGQCCFHTKQLQCVVKRPVWSVAESILQAFLSGQDWIL